MKAPVEITITVHKAKAFDEMAENFSDLGELIDLIPGWNQVEAKVIAQRIADRQLAWVTLKPLDK